MNEKLKAFQGKATDFFKKLNKRTRILLAAAAAALLILLAAGAVALSRQPYTTLLTGLSTTEMNGIVTYLADQGITDYKIVGDTVSVKMGQEDQIMAQLAMAGYPKDGYLYESYFNNVNTLTTNSERDRTFLIAVQTRLERIICNFVGVESAQVTIDLGTDRTFVLDMSALTNSTASVKVNMISGYSLTKELADAIRNLVSHSVQGLSFDSVFLTDQYGSSLTEQEGIGALGDGSEMKLMLEERYNNRIRADILQMLRAVYGADNVQASVNVTVDANKKKVTTEEFWLPEGSAENAGLIGSRSWFWQYGPDGEVYYQGVVGTPSNAEIPIYNEDGAQLDGDTTVAVGQGQENYNQNHSLTEVDVVTCTVTDVQVAVTLNGNVPNALAVDAETLSYHIATAAGIGGEDRGSYVSVLIVPFNVDPVVPDISIFDLIAEMPDWAIYAVLGLLGLLLLVILLTSLLGRRSKAPKVPKEKKKKGKKGKKGEIEEEPEPLIVAAAEAIAANSGGADIMEMNTEKSMELRKSVRQFAQNNPEIAAQMVKNWLRGEEDNG